MKLVIDASSLVAEGLRLRGRQRLADSTLELYLAEHTYDEAHYELTKRLPIFIERTGLSHINADKLKTDVFESLELPFVVLESGYEDFRTTAKERIRDLNDCKRLAYLSSRYDVRVRNLDTGLRFFWYWYSYLEYRKYRQALTNLKIIQASLNTP
jgi:PIN domain